MGTQIVYDPLIHLPDKVNGKWVLNPEERKRRRKETLAKFAATHDVRAYRQKYYQTNKEHINVRVADYRKDNKKKTREWAWNQAGMDLTIEEFDERRKQQNFCCCICSAHEDTVAGKNRGLQADHDHINGRVRGLLCGKCNMALGLFNDNYKLLGIAAEYLDQFN